jgi:beta-lactamase superfamily II metal-dependent hydrolase
VPILHRNPSVSPTIIKQLKSENGMGDGIATLAYLAAKHYTAVPTLWPRLGALDYKEYWNQYPWDFDDENNLSLVLFLKYHNQSIIFPGDLEREGWLKLLENTDFRHDLAKVNIFVASHHGRFGGYCKEVFDYCQPEIIVFSDKSIDYETQMTASLYGQHARGINFFDGKTRYVLTTRKNGKITVSQQGPSAGLIWIEKA